MDMPDSFINTNSTKQQQNYNPLLSIIKNALVKAQDRIYFEESSSRTSSGNIAFAVIILILGISFVIAFFAFLVGSTRFVTKRIKQIKINRKDKNVDIDGDYLINGMYL